MYLVKGKAQFPFCVFRKSVMVPVNTSWVGGIVGGVRYVYLPKSMDVHLNINK
jgi:hypothetical protein